MTRYLAAIGLAAIFCASANGQTGVDTLFVLVNHDDPEIRQRAVESLGTLRWGRHRSKHYKEYLKDRTGPTKSFNALVRALSDENSEVREAAANALSEFKVEGPGAIDRLVPLLLDDETFHAATRALKVCGVEAVEALEEATESPDPLLRLRAVLALGKVSAQGVPPLLLILHTSADEELRWAAARALGDHAVNLGRVRASSLRPGLGDESLRVRNEVSYALGCCGPDAAPAIPDLVAELSGNEKVGASHASSALRCIANDLESGEALLVFPRVYWRSGLGLLLLIATWFLLAARYPRHRPANVLQHLALMGFVAAVPVASACAAVYYAVTREWAQLFLPDALTLVPFPVAALLSTALVVALPAAWVCQRKSVALVVSAS